MLDKSHASGAYEFQVGANASQTVEHNDWRLRYCSREGIRAVESSDVIDTSTKANLAIAGVDTAIDAVNAGRADDGCDN